MAKLLKLRRGTTSQHSSFTGAEGEVTIDTTKDTAVVHDGSQAGGRPLAREDMSNVSSASIAGQLATDSIATSKIAGGALPTDVTVATANIVNGTIVNADIAANAAIQGTKLENSGVGAGTYGSSSAIPIVTVDAQGLVTSASTTAIDSTTIANGSSSVSVANNGAITSNANHDFAAGIDVTGQITATSHIDIPDGAALKLGDSDELSIEHAANGHSYIVESGSGNLNIHATHILLKDASGNSKLTTGSAGVDVTGNLGVSGTVDGADVAAMNTKLSGIESGATADQTKSDIDALNINADTVDSLHASSFVRADANDTASGAYEFSNSGQYPVVIGSTSGMDNGRLLLRGSTSPYIRFREGNSDKAYVQWNADGYIEMYNEETARSIRIKSGSNGLVFNEGGSERTVWHSGNDGSGSGLDADTLDGIDQASFVRSDASDTMGGTYNISSGKLGLKTTPGNTFGNRNAAFAIGDNDTGFAQNGDGQLEAWANNQLRLLWTSGDVESYATIRPASGQSVNLGTSSYRWNNIYTNDLNLSNEGSSNDIDGTWGDWTIQEGESDLFLKNNRSGKKYKFNLTEIS